MIDLLKVLFYYPFINLLTFFTWLTPGHWVAVGIILLTIVIRFALLIPTKRQVESQRQMTALSPALKELQLRYGNDRESLAKAQLALYKAYNVNPFASCLLLPVQMVIIYILFYTITHGMNVDSPHIYSWVPRATEIQTYFFWVDLREIDRTFILPVIATVLQFIQIKLTLPKGKAGQDEDQTIKMQRNFLFLLPLVTLWASATFAAGVVLYWVTTTVFSIIQQLLVNRAMPEKVPVEEALERIATEVSLPSAEIEQKITKSTPKAVVAEKKTGKGGVKVTVRRK